MGNKNGERGIRTLDTGFPVYSLSRRAPSTILGHLSIIFVRDNYILELFYNVK